MTAIAGIIGLDGRPCTPADLRGVLDILAPLGRDGEGCWAGTVGPMGAGLGAVRRRRVPEDDADAQPVHVADGHVVVVADVVLTNRPELCRLLGLPDVRDLTDPDIVAQAYLRWGEACCERLRGEFALAVADRRRGGVLLARDHTGIRPLHVHEGRGWLGFATMALAVTGFDGVPAELDLERAKQFLALVMASEHSWIRDVTPVPPATALWISPAGVQRRRFWEPDLRPQRRGCAAEHAEELRTVFDEAVRSRLRRRGGLGVMLSGGLDSTAVAATVAEQVAPEQVRTYTAVPPPGWSGPTGRRDPDESPLVRRLAARYPNLVPTFLDARGAAAIDGDAETYAAGGTPVRNTTNMMWIRAVHRHAADDGVSALFTGAVGNHAFSRDAERWLIELLMAGRLTEAWREARVWSTQHRVPLAATIRRSVLRELAPAWVHRLRAAGRGQLPPEAAWLSATALLPSLHADVDLRRHPSTSAKPVSPLAHLAGQAGQAEAMGAREAQWGWRHVDPTVDVRLLEVCSRQPGWARRHRGAGRAAARAAMRDRVPDEIRLRSVRGAQLPDWYDRITDAHAEICQELAAAHEHGPSRALIDLGRLDNLVRDWPAPEQAGEYDTAVGLGLIVPRALAVSRYLRWFDQWSADFRILRHKRAL